MKTCTVCKETKPIGEFYNYKASKDGKAYRCKTCDNKARNKWREENPERAAYSLRNRRLKYQYGIDIPEYNKILEEQGGVCACCGRKENNVMGPRRDWNFAVDHCHDTGRIRGLLCNDCNRGIGLLGDNVKGLEKALEYLKGDT